MRLLPLVLTGLLWAGVPGASSAQSPQVAIRAELDSISAAWNRADLDRHVRPYADSATMMGGRGLIRGRAAIRAALERGFWRDGKPLQQLRFEEVEIRTVGGDNAAIVTGKFALTGGGRDEASGRFTTIWEWHGGKWETVHDHSG